MSIRIIAAIFIATALPMLGADPAAKPTAAQPADGAWKNEATGPDASVFAKATNGFAIALHQRLATGKFGENLAFSPVSLASALAMTGAGAAGDTEKEMLRVLGLQGIEKPHEAAGVFLKSLAAGDDQTIVAPAQGIWLKQGVNIMPDFGKTATEHYQAANEVLDFSNPAKAVEHINGWVSKQTHERVTDLFDTKSITAETRLVLASALYFKSRWAVPFQAENTTHGEFKLMAKKTTNVPFMHRGGKMDHAETKTLQALRLPYTSKDWSLIILLPRETAGLAALEAQLTAESLQKIIGGLKSERTELTLPKFTAKSRLDIRGSLQGLGMTRAFTDDADFSRLAEKGKELMISKVLHQTFFEVNEEGTEAAAATGIILKPKGALTEEKPKEFNADHPFLYLIRHEPSGAIVFIGRLTHPAAGA